MYFSTLKAVADEAIRADRPAAAAATLISVPVSSPSADA